MNVLIANSEIAMLSGDIKKALSILRAVPNSSPYFKDSRFLLADIYLKHLKDRRHYAQCYYDLVANDGCFENYKLLGNALMEI